MLTVLRIFCWELTWMTPCLLSCSKCSHRSIARLLSSESPHVTVDISKRSPLWLKSSTLTGTLTPLASPPPSPSPLLPPTVLTSDLTALLKPRRSPPGGRLLPTPSGGRCRPPPLTITPGRLLCRPACSARRLTPLVWPTSLEGWLALIAFQLSPLWCFYLLTLP